MKTFLKRWYKLFFKTLIYLAFLIVLAVPAVFTNTVFGYLPVIVALVVTILSLLMFMFAKRGIVISAGNGNAECTRGEKVSVDLKVENRSVFVWPKVVADIFISDYFGNDDSGMKTTFSLDSKSITDFGFDITMNHVGQYTAGIKSMRVYGLMGLFYVTIPFEDKFRVTVLPQIKEGDTSLSEDMLTDAVDATNFTEADGFDYTGVREYALGDSMKRIHWKLSAHSSVYMTKISEIGRKSDLTVIIDMVAKEYDSDTLLSINDSIIETAASLFDWAERKDIEYKGIFLDKEYQLSTTVPRNRSDYADLIRRIAPITASPVEKMPDAQEIISEEMQFANRSANVIVCTSRVTDELLQSLVSARAQQRNPMLYYIIEPDSSEKRRSEAASDLRLLEENDINYQIVS